MTLAFDRMDPSSTVGGASKEAGPSCSVSGDAAKGLVGVPEDEVVPVVTGPELGEAGGKEGGSSLKPGLLGEGSRAAGERARLAYRERESDVTVMSQCSSVHTSRGQQRPPGLTWSFSISAEFLLALVGRGEVTPAGC